MALSLQAAAGAPRPFHIVRMNCGSQSSTGAASRAPGRSFRDVIAVLDRLCFDDSLHEDTLRGVAVVEDHFD